MAAGAVFAWLSYRSAFVLLALFLIGALVLVLLMMLVNPSLYPSWAFAALTGILLVTIGLAVWVVLHPEEDEEVQRD